MSPISVWYTTCVMMAPDGSTATRAASGVALMLHLPCSRPFQRCLGVLRSGFVGCSLPFSCLLLAQGAEGELPLSRPWAHRPPSLPTLRWAPLSGVLRRMPEGAPSMALSSCNRTNTLVTNNGNRLNPHCSAGVTLTSNNRCVPFKLLHWLKRPASFSSNVLRCSFNSCLSLRKVRMAVMFCIVHIVQYRI